MNVPANLATPENLPFSRLGPYRIDRRVGQGGMGDVYLGYEEALDRPVAVKVLPPELARNEDFIQRFRTEAAAVAKLNHPHVVCIYSIGTDAGRHYFAMQYVEGESLDRLLARHGRLGVGQALFILEQILGGLEAIHRAGLIHRDIKPANILIEGKSQRVLVADFGLAKSTAAAGMTATGVVVGTVDYLSPEQARGQKTDQRADLYSLGVLVFQMLSGRLPFEAETPSGMMFQHAYEKPFSLQALAAEVPAGLTAIVEKLMAKAPAERYQSCAEVLAALRRSRSSVAVGIAPPDKRPAASAQPSQSAPIRFEEEPASLAWESASPRGWWTGLRQRLRDYMRAYTPEFVQSLQTTGQQVDGAVAEYEQRRDQLAQLLAEAREAAEELTAQARNHRTAAREAAQRAERTPQSEDRHSALREKEESERTAGELEEQVSQQQEQIGALEARFAQADATLLKLRNQRDVLNARLRVAQARLDIEGVQKPLHRRRLGIAAVLGAAVALGLVYGFVASTGSGRGSKIVAEPEKVVEKPSDSGDRVAVAANITSPEKNGKTKPTKRIDSAPVTERPLPRAEKSALSIQPMPLSFKPGDPISPLAMLQKPPRLPGVLSWSVEPCSGQGKISLTAFSGDGRWLATCGGDGVIRLWDDATGRLNRVLLGHAAEVSSLSWAPDSRYLASGSLDKTVKIWEVGSGKLLQTLDGHSSRINCVAWSPDHQTLASSATGQGDLAIRLWDLASGKQRATVSLTGGVSNLAWSADGNTLAALNQGTVCLVNSKSQAVRSIDKCVSLVDGFAVSPDDKTLALGVRNQGVHLWQIESGKTLGVLDKSEASVNNLTWSLDGQRIAGCSTQEIHVWDAVTQQLLRNIPLISCGSMAVWDNVLSWSADSKELAYCDKDGCARVWNTHTHSSSYTIQGQLVGRGQAAWSANGKTLATADVNHPRAKVLINKTWLWNIETNKPPRALELPIPSTIHDICWSPDSKILALGCENRLVRLWSIDSDRLLHDLAGHTNFDILVSWSPDGKKLVSSAHEKDLRLWDALSGTLLKTLSDEFGSKAIAWSPQGDKIASVSRKKIALWNAEGTFLEKMDRTLGFAPYVAWSADGGFLAVDRMDGVGICNTNDQFLRGVQRILSSVTR